MINGIYGSFVRSCRFSLIITGFFGCMLIFSLRVNMSMAIVCITKDTHRMNSNLSHIKSEDKSKENQTKSEINEEDELIDWDERTQGLILGSFYIGYILTQMPGGLLARKCSAKQVFGWSMLFCAVATIFTPFAARSSVNLLIAVRIFTGLCQGVTIPCLHKLLSVWIPPFQRSIAVAFVYAGVQLGIVVTFQYSGVLCADGFDNGWPSIFYISGSVGVIWFIAWMVLVFDSPVIHPRISQHEKMYILNNIKSEVDSEKSLTSTPWSKIFTSRAVWAIVVLQTCSEWGLFIFMTNIPSYMEDVLEFEIKNNGFLSSIPYLGFFVVTNMTAVLADFVRKQSCMTTALTRKLLSGLGSIVPAICIAILANIAENKDLAVVLLTIGVAMTGVQFGSGYLVNVVDIAPKYASIIMAFSNCIASLCGFFAPFAVGYIVKDKTKEEWKTVFYITAGLYVCGSIVFVLFASGEVQTWALEDNFNIEKEVTGNGENQDMKVMENNKA